MNADTCVVCNQPIVAHRVVNWCGVAHVINADGRRCSVEDGERSHYAGRIDMLRTVIRSLRWRAGRLRSRQKDWTADDLDEYSNHWQQRLDCYMAILREYYQK